MKKDIITNYISQIINILLRFILIPIYISKLGVSSFGIIGFYYSIESILVLADFGIGLNSNKLIAEKFKSEPTKTYETIRSVEIFYVSVAFLIGIVVFISSDWIALDWLIVGDINFDVIYVIQLMAILLAVNWPKTLYENFLIGLLKISEKNYISIFFNILRSVIMILCFTELQSTIEMYFYVMIITILIELIVMRVFISFNFKKNSSNIHFKYLKPFLKNSLGLGIFSILSLFVFQTDKFIISKNLEISELGIYNASSIIPLAMLSIIYPIVSASFPRLVNINSNDQAKNIFKETTFLLALLCSAYFLFIYSNLEFIGKFWLKENFNTINISVSYFILLGIFLHSFTNLSTNLLIANNKSFVVNCCYLISLISFFIYLFFVNDLTLVKISIGWLICNVTLLILYFINLFIIYKKLSVSLILTFLRFFTCISFFLIFYHFVLIDINVAPLIKLFINSTSIILFIFIFSFNKIILYVKPYFNYEK